LGFEVPGKNGPVHSQGAVLAEHLTLTDLLQTVSGVIGWSKPVMVDLIEALSSPPMPVTRMLEMAVTWPEQSESEPYQRQHCKTARQLRPSEIDALVAAYQAGSTVYELAKHFGIHRATVGQHLRTRGVDTTPPGLDLDDLPIAVKLYQEGWSLAKIAERFDTSSNTVRKSLRETGVVMRRPWERG
jgi:hypothetical protein